MAIAEAEVAHRAASDAELIAWVDEQDQLLGVCHAPNCVIVA